MTLANKAVALLAVLLSTVSFGQPANSATLAGVHLPRELQVGGNELTLAICGRRDTVWINHYVVGLYLPRGTTTLALLNPETSKAVRMHIVQSRHLPREIPKKWRDAMQRELEHEPMSRVRRAYQLLSKGDVVTISYVPQQGVTMSVNGSAVLQAAAGHGVINSILNAWAENDPVTEKLKRLALEHHCKTT